MNEYELVYFQGPGDTGGNRRRLRADTVDLLGEVIIFSIMVPLEGEDAGLSDEHEMIFLVPLNRVVSLEKILPKEVH